MERLSHSEPLPKDLKIDRDKSPMQRLMASETHHEYVKQYLVDRLRASEREMEKNYDRWAFSERRHQAYMNLPKYEKMLKDMNDKGLPPQPAIITFPYQYAVTSTIVTYLTRVFCGRNPIFSLSAHNAQTAKNVRNMETLLQMHAEYTRLTRLLFQYFLDGEMYGLSIARVLWAEEWQNRTVWKATNPLDKILGSNQPYSRMTELQRVYQGNICANIDPFMFFPDPNVPMSMCAERGEYVFWRDFIGKHRMLQESAGGSIMGLEKVTEGNQTSSKWYNLSSRNLLTGGESHAGQQRHGAERNPTSVYQIDQGTVEIIPKELGLGDTTYPEKWLFAIANGQRVIQAEPLGMHHNRHPIAVAEPYSMGYGFSQPALSDYIGPVQDIVSWFVDSHIFNVRAALNNMWLVDPSKVEMQDILNPKPGKIIRLKPTAIGTDVRTVMQQLPVADVTSRHMADMDAFIRMGDTVSAVNENLRGLQESGGRKTATEIRVSGDSAASRLQHHAMKISAMGITEIARQMVLNIQQYQDQDIALRATDGNWTNVSPNGLTGDFLFPVHDGSLPVDKVAQLEVWEKIFGGMLQDPELRQSYNVPQVFEWMASDLGGAYNLQNFRRVPMAGPALPGQAPMMPGIQPQLANPEQIQQGLQQGALVPLNPNMRAAA